MESRIFMKLYICKLLSSYQNIDDSVNTKWSK